MRYSKRILLPLVAVLVLGAGWATPASAQKATKFDVTIVGFPAGPDGPFIDGLTGFIIDEDDNIVGTYFEEVTPVFVGGMLVGTTGVSTFRFDDGTITTTNVSFVVGVDPLPPAEPAETLFVESEGTVVGATGGYKKSGGFESSSVVELPNFLFFAQVEFNLEK